MPSAYGVTWRAGHSPLKYWTFTADFLSRSVGRYLLQCITVTIKYYIILYSRRSPYTVDVNKIYNIIWFNLTYFTMDRRNNFINYYTDRVVILCCIYLHNIILYPLTKSNHTATHQSLNRYLFAYLLIIFLLYPVECVYIIIYNQ